MVKRSRGSKTTKQRRLRKEEKSKEELNQRSKKLNRQGGEECDKSSVINDSESRISTKKKFGLRRIGVCGRTLE